MEQGPDKNARVPLRITAPLTGILVFVSLLILDAWNIAPHSSLRAAIVGGASSLVVTALVRLLYKRRGP